VRRVLSNEWLANLKKNYKTSGFFGTPFLCHQRNGVKEKKYQEKEKSVQSKTNKKITKTNKSKTYKIITKTNIFPKNKMVQ